MASEFSIPTIIQYQKISQYLAANDKSSLTQLRSGSFIGILPKLLYMEGTLLQNMNTLNPGVSTLRGAAEYVLSLCGKYAIQAKNILNSLAGGLATITGPTSQSVLVGQTATFSVSVASASPVSYQWYLNNILIPGATSSSYLVTNAQLIQSGGLYSVVATNGAGPTTSVQASLTVTASLVGFYYQGSTDYSTLLLAGTDSVVYLGTFPITTGQPLNVTFPDLVSTEYLVVKYPATETTKTSYLNPPPSGPDTGVIPSLALDTTTFGGWKYIFSRTGNTFGMNNINGQVRFS